MLSETLSKLEDAVGDATDARTAADEAATIADKVSVDAQAAIAAFTAQQQAAVDTARHDAEIERRKADVAAAVVADLRAKADTEIAQLLGGSLGRVR